MKIKFPFKNCTSVIDQRRGLPNYYCHFNFEKLSYLPLMVLAIPCLLLTGNIKRDYANWQFALKENNSESPLIFQRIPEGQGRNHWQESR